MKLKKNIFINTKILTIEEEKKYSGQLDNTKRQ